MKVRHILGISGGKDSTALAVYLKNKYSELDVEYFFCDTDKELPETYEYLERLKIYLGKPIKILPERKRDVHLFDQLLMTNGGFLPSVRQRWCTVQMKLRPLEEFVATDKVISYVGIRGDEERSAYISKRDNIQSIFPFRKNIWSDDVILIFLQNQRINKIAVIYQQIQGESIDTDYFKTLIKEVGPSFDVDMKIKALLDIDVKLTNKIIFNFLKSTEYPLAYLESFPLIDNDEVLGIEDIFSLLEESGLGLPEYYNEIEFEVDGKKGQMSRSRSGCYFCFFQQRIDQINIKLSKRSGWIRFDISNAGDGIQSDKIDHIFDRFFRVDSSRTKGDKKGYGLGLALAKNIVEVHNGKISVISKPGQKTTFTFLLPIKNS